jgi:uncharacterized protein (TIGR01244 family)
MTTLSEIKNYRAVDDLLATAGQPSEAQLAAVAAAGFKVVINLGLHDDPRYSLQDEPGLVKSLGMEYRHVPVQFGSPTEGDLQAFFAAMQASQGSKILAHCAANMRVSSFLGLYRAIHQHEPVGQAFALMREIWEPNVVWTKFIRDALVKHGLSPDEAIVSTK